MVRVRKHRETRNLTFWSGVDKIQCRHTNKNKSRKRHDVPRGLKFRIQHRGQYLKRVVAKLAGFMNHVVLFT